MIEEYKPVWKTSPSKPPKKISVARIRGKMLGEVVAKKPIYRRSTRDGAATRRPESTTRHLRIDFPPRKPYAANMRKYWISRTFSGLLLMGAVAGPGAASAKDKPALKDKYVQVNGLKLHCVTAGKGPLILFLHGFPEFWYEWKNQLAEFGKDHLAVAPDMRGYNLSDKPNGEEQYRMSYLVDDVLALANHFSRGRKFVLVAHDWGGAIAWSFAIAHPDYLQKLVIVNAPHPGVFARLLASDSKQQQASQYMLMFRSAQAEQMLSANNYAGLVNGVLGAGLKNGVFTENDKQAYITAWSQPGALTGGLNYYRANRVGPPAPEQASAGNGNAAASTGNFALDPASLTVKVPTLVIWGEKDTALLTGNLDGLDQFVPQLTVKRIPEGSHWVIHEKAKEVNGYIREFIH
jgi:pimeloyl-ACP methyl ester carboxylesterase